MANPDDLQVASNQGVALDYRKRQQGNGVQHENRSERDGNLFLACIGDWGNRRNGAAATDGCAGRDQIRDSLLYRQQPSQAPAKKQGNANAPRGIDESGASRLHDLLQIHSEPEPYNRCRQEQLR